MNWQKEALKKHGGRILTGAAFAVILALVTLLWHYATGSTFAWENIHPVDEPGLMPRLFYSALVFVGPGWFLYHKLKLWKFLYEPYRGGGRGAYREYKKMKVVVWWGLILLMYFIIVPFVVGVLNTIISSFYNALNLLLFLAPPLGITVIVFVVGLILYKVYKQGAS